MGSLRRVSDDVMVYDDNTNIGGCHCDNDNVYDNGSGLITFITSVSALNTYFKNESIVMIKHD